MEEIVDATMMVVVDDANVEEVSGDSLGEVAKLVLE